MTLGDSRTFSTSLAKATTNSPDYINKATLVTPALPAEADNYLIIATWAYQNAHADPDFQLEVEEGGVQFYETGRLHTFESLGVGDADPAETYAIAFQRFLGGGVHNIDFNFRAVSGDGDLVAIEQLRMEFFALDVTFKEAISDAVSSTFSTSYQLKAAMAGLILAAGTYRIGFSCEYRCEDDVNNNNLGLRFRERKDPAGADVITNLLGADSGDPLELELNNGGDSVASAAPWQCATWWTACRELEADTYDFELAFRAVGGLFDEVEVQKARLLLWRTE